MTDIALEVHRAFKAANVVAAEAEAAARAVVERGERIVTRDVLRADLERSLTKEHLEERVGRRLYGLFAALGILITNYEFIG